MWDQLSCGINSAALYLLNDFKLWMQMTEIWVQKRLISYNAGMCESTKCDAELILNLPTVARIQIAQKRKPNSTFIMQQINKTNLG